jgi:hypothetical protein
LVPRFAVVSTLRVLVDIGPKFTCRLKRILMHQSNGRIVRRLWSFRPFGSQRICRRLGKDAIGEGCHRQIHRTNQRAIASHQQDRSGDAYHDTPDRAANGAANARDDQHPYDPIKKPSPIEGVPESFEPFTHSAILGAGSLPARVPVRQSPELTKGFLLGSLFKLTHYPPLTPRNKNGTMFFLCSKNREADMLKTFVEEAAALASITLFVGMIAVWAQLIPQL